MDPIINPFSPGAGAPPPELVGREDILTSANVLIKRLERGFPVQSVILTGLRGVGKTVLLGEVRRMAAQTKVIPIHIEATEERSLSALLVAPLKKTLFELDRQRGAKEKVKRSLMALRNFIGTVKVEMGDFGLEIEPQHGIADSGDFAFDLGELLATVAEAAQEKQQGVLLILDEIQYLGEKDLDALIMAMHRMQQDSLPMALFAAGLPFLPGLTGNVKSYAERLIHFQTVGALSPEDSAKAIREPFAEAHVVLTDEAATCIHAKTQGYPYFLQEWGYQLWNAIEASPILAEAVEAVTPKVLRRLDESFFRVRMERMTNAEKEFVFAMAELPGPTPKVSEIAARLHANMSALGPRRSALIKKGMVYSPSHGTLAFSVPLFSDYLNRHRAQRLAQ